MVAYRVKRLRLALAASFVAGNVSSLLGIGGGVIKVPVLNAWCGVPVRAAATSAFMIGVTATGGAVIYFGRGQLSPALAAAAVVGVQIGSRVAIRLGSRVPARGLKALMAAVLVVVAILMFLRGSACLLAGLVLSYAPLPPAAGAAFLRAGLVLLFATPVSRVAASAISYFISRDWCLSR
jgi:hypothetical protein